MFYLLASSIGGARYHFHDFLSDGGLPGFVVFDGEFVEELVRVVVGVIHGVAAACLLAELALGEAVMEYGS